MISFLVFDEHAIPYDLVQVAFIILLLTMMNTKFKYKLIFDEYQSPSVSPSMQILQ